MEKNLLRFDSRQKSGTRYTCILTDELDSLLNGKGLFKLCRNFTEEIIRIEYKNRSIGDFMVKKDFDYTLKIKKHSLYLGNISHITELNKNSIINDINRILIKHVGSELYM